MAVALWLIVKVIPQQLTTGDIKEPSKRDEATGRARTGVLAVLAGSLAAIGAYYTHRTFGLNQQGQITERFTRAVDQLGGSLDVRLGGIYALERLARESRNDHGPIIEILTAYVREHTRAASHEQTAGQAPKPQTVAAQRVTTDVQAALTVLGRRILAHDPPTPWVVNLADAHLERAILSDAHLERAILTDAHLEGARLARAHLEGALLARAHLEGARLTGAHLEGAILTDAHLEGARLTDAHLEGAVLTDAQLAEADLDGATWSDETQWPHGFDPERTSSPGSDDGPLA